MRLVYDRLNTASSVCVQCDVCGLVFVFSYIFSPLVSPQVKKSHSESHVPDPLDTRYTYMCLFV